VTAWTHLNYKLRKKSKQVLSEILFSHTLMKLTLMFYNRTRSLLILRSNYQFKKNPTTGLRKEFQNCSPNIVFVRHFSGIKTVEKVCDCMDTLELQTYPISRKKYQVQHYVLL
jgi:hypothetical protein